MVLTEQMTFLFPRSGSNDDRGQQSAQSSEASSSMRKTRSNSQLSPSSSSVPRQASSSSVRPQSSSSSARPQPSPRKLPPVKTGSKVLGFSLGSSLGMSTSHGILSPREESSSPQEDHMDKEVTSVNDSRIDCVVINAGGTVRIEIGKTCGAEGIGQITIFVSINIL